MKAQWQQGEIGEYVEVTAEDIANVISMMTGVPAQRMAEGESKRLKDLEHNLKHKVIAQDNAINKMVKTILRNRVGLRDPNHPIGVFMFLGPTGVGKTYLAQKLAEEMFGSKDSLIRIDMSEFSESFNASRLVGAPPGYVGYNEGGQLTEKVRRKPYSIVLLDEIEKANSKVCPQHRPEESEQAVCSRVSEPPRRHHHLRPAGSQCHQAHHRPRLGRTGQENRRPGVPFPDYRKGKGDGSQEGIRCTVWCPPTPPRHPDLHRRFRLRDVTRWHNEARRHHRGRQKFEKRIIDIQETII